MKNMMENLLKSIIICSLLLFAISCSDTNESVIKEQQIKTSSISFKSAPVEISVDEMLEEISDPKIQNAIKKFTNKGNSFRGEIQEEYFEKIELETYTNYSMNVKDVSEAEPYFLVLLITKSNDGIEKAGFLKYTPTNITDEFHIKTFSGSMQLLDLDFNPVVETLFDNGLYTSSTSMWSENCTTTMSIVEVECSNGGHHGVGESCGSGLQNDAYLSVLLNTICTYSYTIDYNGPSIFISSSGSLTNEQRFFNGLTTTQRNFLQSNPLVKATIITYLERVSYSAGRTYAIWSINYMINNPSVTIEQIKNWFLSASEGKDGVYDADFWEDPNLILPQQNLPSMQNFLYAFPKIQNGSIITNMPSAQVYELVGGSIYTNHLSGNVNYKNACSIRGSRALNYAGASIPVIIDGNVQKTEKGSDNENYILSAKAFNAYMHKTFGPPTYTLTREQIGDDPQVIVDFLQNKNGIYTVVNNNPGQAGYSGHVDVIINGQCLGGANAAPKGGVLIIEIWELN